jgi:hypothetical protein
MAAMVRVQYKSRSGNYDSEPVITQINVPNGKSFKNAGAKKHIVTDREYFGLRLAFMVNSAFMEA